VSSARRGAQLALTQSPHSFSEANSDFTRRGELAFGNRSQAPACRDLLHFPLVGADPLRNFIAAEPRHMGRAPPDVKSRDATIPAPKRYIVSCNLRCSLDFRGLGGG